MKTVKLKMQVKQHSQKLDKLLPMYASRQMGKFIVFYAGDATFTIPMLLDFVKIQ